MEKLIKFFTPETYNLNLEINRETEDIIGEVEIFGHPHGEFVKFHAVNIEIENILVRKADEDVKNLNNKNFSEYLPCDFEQKSGEIKIKNFYHAENHTKNYLLAYKIKFQTKINQNLQGCYLSKYVHQNQTKKLVTTQFESHYARECFPCIDEPAAKAEFNLQITVPDLADEDVVLANTELESQNGREFVFATTPRMSTYLLAWTIGPLKSISGVNKNGVKISSYAALNQTTSSLEFANEVAMRALEYYDEKFGIKYPLTKLDQVALPDFEAGAMENWGLVTYRESCMLAEPNASIDTKQSVAITITHELSHQWFGDLVTMRWWDDLWLNESFATIMEYYATDALYPEFKVWQDFYTGDCVAALRRDCLPGVQAVRQDVHDPSEIATLFDSAIVYAKGARLVLMLIHLLGAENFDKGVRDYFQKYQYNNTVGDDLWNSLQPYAEFDVQKFMHAWISQPGYPMLWQENDKYEQCHFLIDNSTDDTTWPLPEVKYDMSGHYIIKLSDDELMGKLDNYNALSMEARLRVLIDRMLLAKTKYVQSASLLDLLPKFVNEDAAVWDILLGIINDLKVFFDYNSDEEKLYQQYLRHIMYSRVREIGVVSEPSDNSDLKRLRSTLAVIARFARDEEIIAQLAAEYQPDLSKIDSEMRGNILMAKLMADDMEIFPILFAKYESESNPELKDDILCTLASTRDDSHIAQMVELLSRPAIVRPQDHLFLYIYLLRNPKARLLALDWLYTHWTEVVKMSGEKSIEDYPRCTANFIHDRHEADCFYDFFSQFSDDPVLSRTLVMSRASIEARLQLISSDAPAVHTKIKDLAKDL